jgi:hypothetical protein
MQGLSQLVQERLDPLSSVLIPKYHKQLVLHLNPVSIRKLIIIKLLDELLKVFLGTVIRIINSCIYHKFPIFMKDFNIYHLAPRTLQSHHRKMALQPMNTHFIAQACPECLPSDSTCFP